MREPCSTNELLVGLFKEDGVVGLVGLAVLSNCREQSAGCNRRSDLITYRHLECMQPAALWCVELSWGPVGGDGAAHDVRCAVGLNRGDRGFT